MSIKIEFPITDKAYEFDLILYRDGLAIQVKGRFCINTLLVKMDTSSFRNRKFETVFGDPFLKFVYA